MRKNLFLVPFCNLHVSLWWNSFIPGFRLWVCTSQAFQARLIYPDSDLVAQSARYAKSLLAYPDRLGLVACTEDPQHQRLGMSMCACTNVYKCVAYLHTYHISCRIRNMKSNLCMHPWRRRFLLSDEDENLAFPNSILHFSRVLWKVKLADRQTFCNRYTLSIQ